MIRKDYIPFGKPDFSEDEIAAVTRVMRSGWVGMGPEVIAFEEELAEFLGAPHVVTVNSCTSALFLSLLVHGVGLGDEVICPSLTWCSTANVALHLGARPVFCDVDPATLCLTPELVREKLTSRTRAVMAVHMGGLAVEVDGLREVLPGRVAIIEDAAHALGAKFEEGRPVGSSGNPTCFSFYANKNLSAGEGGAVAVFDEKTAARLRSLRLHGMDVDAWKRFSNPRSLLLSELKELGYKMNYTDLQASIGRIQLKRQEEFHATRLGIAEYYRAQLQKIIPDIGIQSNITHPYHSRHLFVLILPLEEMRISRDELILALRERNVGAAIHYTPLHSMPLYKEGTTQADLPHTDRLGERILTLPISASMDLDDAAYVAEQIKDLMGC